MAQNFRGPEIYHRHLVEMVPPLCRSTPETESRAPRHQAHGPGAGLDPYTTSSPIAVVGEEAPTLVPDLNRAINNRWPAEREIADAQMREPRQAGGAWRGSSMTLGLKGKRERKHLVWPRVDATLMRLFLASN